MQCIHSLLNNDLDSYVWMVELQSACYLCVHPYVIYTPNLYLATTILDHGRGSNERARREHEEESQEAQYKFSCKNKCRVKAAA